MKFKALKHKTLENMWGYIWGNDIVTDDRPQLLPERWDMDSMRRSALYDNEDQLLEKLEDYDLVEVDVLMKDEAKEHAWRVFDRASTLFFPDEKRAYFEELWDKTENDGTQQIRSEGEKVEETQPPLQ